MADLAAGSKIGNYEILKLLGRGGMGEVYLAQDVRLNRTVALKILPSELAKDHTRMERFSREAKAAASLNHPNICTIHEIGSENGQNFISMEYIEGTTLQKRIAGEPLEIAEVLDVATQIADALEEARKKNIVHRDIKSANILLTERKQVKLLDFGLAKVIVTEKEQMEGASTISKLTDTGIVLGTVAYMSPEQTLGKPVDHRSDLFSFGVVMYEMLTGSVPFTGSSTAELLDAILHQTPHSIARYNRKVPDELMRIVEKMLEKDPDDRYQSAHEIWTDLRRLRTGTAQVAAAPQKTKATRYHFPAFIVILLLAAAVAISVWAIYRKPAGQQQYSSVALLPLKNISDNPKQTDYLADGVTEAVITRLVQLPNLRVIPWMTAQRYKNTSLTPQKLAEEMEVDTILTGTIRTTETKMAVTISLIDGESGLQFWGDEFEEQAGEIFGVQRKIALEVATRLKGELTDQQQEIITKASSKSSEAYEYFLRGQAIELKNEKDADLAFQLFQRAINLDPGLAEAYTGIGRLHFSRYYMGWRGQVENLEESEKNFREALHLDSSLTSSYLGLIGIYWMKGQSEECLKLGQQVPLNSRDATAVLTRALAYYFAGLEPKSIPLFERVLELDAANEEANFYLVPANLAIGDFDKAISAGQRFVDKFGDTPRNYLGTAYHELGQLDSAKVEYEKYIERAGDDFVTYINAGVLLNQLNQQKEAERIWRQGVAILTRMLTSYPQNPRLRAFLAMFHGYLNDRSGLMEQEKSVLAQEPQNGYLLMNLGRAHAALGDYEGAVKFFDRALQAGLTEFYFRRYLKAQGYPSIQQFPPYQEFLKRLDKRLNQLVSTYAN